jgi:hypothetical protein
VSVLGSLLDCELVTVLDCMSVNELDLMLGCVLATSLVSSSDLKWGFELVPLLEIQLVAEMVMQSDCQLAIPWVKQMDYASEFRAQLDCVLVLHLG